MKKCDRCGNKFPFLKYTYYTPKNGKQLILCDSCRKTVEKGGIKTENPGEVVDKAKEKDTSYKIIGIIAGFMGVIFCLIGSVLPWGEYETSAGYQSFYGIEGDGLLTLILSIVVLVLLVYAIFTQIEKHIRYIGIINLLLCIIIGLIALNVSFNFSEYDTVYQVTGTGTHSGSGMMVVCIGAFILFLSSIFLIVAKIEKKQKSQENKDEPLKLLKLRYAKGEITKEEYEQMKKDIE